MTSGQGKPLGTLNRAECLALLRGPVYVGRIGYVTDGLPIIVPVNFTLDGDDAIVFTTGDGSKLSWLRSHHRVAFEVDDSHPVDQSGWSVLIHGIATEITDPARVRELQKGSRSWAVPPTEHWVKVTIDTISGRWLGHPVTAAMGVPTAAR